MLNYNNLINKDIENNKTEWTTVLEWEIDKEYEDDDVSYFAKFMTKVKYLTKNKDGDHVFQFITLIAYNGTEYNITPEFLKFSTLEPSKKDNNTGIFKLHDDWENRRTDKQTKDNWGKWVDKPSMRPEDEIFNDFMQFLQYHNIETLPEIVKDAISEIAEYKEEKGINCFSTIADVENATYANCRQEIYFHTTDTTHPIWMDEKYNILNEKEKDELGYRILEIVDPELFEKIDRTTGYYNHAMCLNFAGYVSVWEIDNYIIDDYYDILLVENCY